MLRLAFVVAAGFLLSACVFPPPTDYRVSERPPYPPAYDSSLYTSAAFTPGFEDDARLRPVAPAEPVSAGSDGYPRGGDAIRPATDASDAGFAEETVDYGVPPTSTLHLHDFDAPTPTRIEGARTVTTVELERMLASPNPPVLIDVIGGKQTYSLPGAVWLRDAGIGRHLDDDVQAWFDWHLARLTAHDKSRPLVLFCASRFCWLAHNAALRALDLGYTDVSWYRGGRDAWQAAGLPMAPVAPSPVDD